MSNSYEGVGTEESPACIDGSAANVETVEVSDRVESENS